MTDPRRWRILALLSTAFFMTIMDSTVLFTALPSIEADFHTDAEAVQWTASAYLLAFSGLLLLGGRAADLLGRRQVFLTGIALRVLASSLCGLAPSLPILIAARALQGISAAIIAPAALSIVVTTFAEGPERNRALAIWGGLGGVGATTGLLLGGVITNVLGWQWVFLINVPLGIAVLALAPALLPESRAADRVRSFDITGALTVTAALVLIVYLIIDAPVTGWANGRTTVLAIASAVLVGVFILVERRAPAPLVPPRVLRSRTLIGGNVVILLAGMAVDGMLITLTAYVQQVLGWSALHFGLVAAVMTLTSVAGAFVTQRVVTGLGVRVVATTGTVLLALSCLLLTQVSTHDFLPVVIAALFGFGAGMGAAFVCSQIAALTGVAERDAGLAAGLVDTSFAMGGALGIAICTSVATARARTVDGGALLTGQRAAFGVATIFGVAGVVAVLTLLPRSVAKEARETETIRN
jgi:EmrB/QacA subfamily drug resistance transporter